MLEDLRIENHKLVGGDAIVDLTHRPAPNRQWALHADTICIHYDVCHSLEMSTRAQFASKLYYHVAIDATDQPVELPKVRQIVPFNLQGSHIKGRNRRTLGIVIVNPGPLIRCRDGKLRTTYYERSFRERGNLNAPTWDENEALELRHPHPNAPSKWTHWATFTHQERDALLEVCKLLVAEYAGIERICGHEYLDPGNKFDPGPAAETSIMAAVRGAFPNLDVPGYPEDWTGAA